MRRLATLAAGGILASAALGGDSSPPPVAEAPPASPRHLTPEARRAIERGLKFLASKQQGDGSWTASGKEFPTAVTSLAGLALLAAGSTPGQGEYHAQVERAVEYVLSSVRANGLIASASEQRPMYGHGFAMLFLAQALGMNPDPKTEERIREALRRAIDLTAACQSRDGGWYYEPNHLQDEGSVTITQVQALRACHNAGVPVPKGVIENAIGYIEKSQGSDGGLRYQANREGPSRLSITAAGVATLFNAGAYDHPVAKAGMRYLRENLKPDDKTQGHYFYCHLYAAQAYYQAGDADWDRYFPAVRDEILRMQDPDGAWSSYVGNSYATATALLILEIPYQYLPVFER